ncbi:hypothetical protein KU306_13820 [Haloferax larsenii]|uniref:DUF8124 domain-containing protein n=1 Tax=Haloferax larsenii TaxID=302484 RepID=A0ABY5RD71_HALLR|nr:hypothetical protein [Haloferax larsenii]UVE49975.1 hypothetical protein KU306_13820 [Haloferax larsenii]
MTDRDETTTERSPDADEPARGDTFGVGVHVTETELRFVVNVPSDIDSGWTDPDEFQRLVERATWERLDQEQVLRAIATHNPVDETVFLGRITLTPDGTVVAHDLSEPVFDAE